LETSPGAASRPNFTSGQIVSTDPNTGMVTVRTGTGANAREQQFRVGDKARFFNANRQALTDGLSFNGFSPGANVFFQSGAGGQGNIINDLRLFDPNSAIMDGKFSNGQIVNVDPQTGFVTIRTGSGANVREQRLRVGNDTRFFGPDLLGLNDGLGFNGFRNGVPVWFQAGTGDLSNTLGGLSLGDPSALSTGAAGSTGGAAGGSAEDQGPAPMGETPGVGGKFLRGVIVVSNADAGAVTLRVGSGANESEMQLKTTPDTRYFGADRQPITVGLNFRAFRAGADVWFLTNTSDLNGNITDLRLYMPMVQGEATAPGATVPNSSTTDTPSAQPKSGSKFVSGKVVSFDPDERTIMVKTGVGREAKEQSFRVASDAEFFGPERQAVSEGLKFSGFKPGIDVWMRVGTGDMANTVRDLRMYDPSKNVDK